MKRIYYTFPCAFSQEGYSRLLNWAYHKFSCVAFLNSNQSNKDPYSSHETLIAFGVHKQICTDELGNAFDDLKKFSDSHNDWLFGFLSYDLKNQKEVLYSKHDDGIQMPLMHFFLPKYVLRFQKEKVTIGVLEPYACSRFAIAKLLKEAQEFNIAKEHFPSFKVKHKVTKEDYLWAVDRIKQHIQKGDIYEMNYCIEFFANDVMVDPVAIYQHLNNHNPSPFSCFYKINDKYLISSTPERFMAKRGNLLISQPIKGTIKRGSTSEEDSLLKNQLLNDPKEKSENVMIVDLVRNDMAQTANPGSVQVKELCGIYSYARVHQMISTITAELDSDFHFTEALKSAFPMGSMTGAPKIKSMELIEQYEKTKRGLYSGAVGYISPQKDFDFNVIIRSILYNRTNKFISFMSGSAITNASVPEKEYQECLLKAEAMANTLGITL